MIIAVTGHRPDKLGFEWDGKGPISTEIRNIMRDRLISDRPERIISGMAIGIDQIWAEVGIELGIPVLAAIPCKGQSNVWPASSQRRYNKILENPLVESKVLANRYSYSVMQRRNRFMVDLLKEGDDSTNTKNYLLAFWNGSNSGTCNCITYAKSVGVNTIVVDINPIVERNRSKTSA